MYRESITLHNFQVKRIPHTGLKIRQSPARIIFREKSLIPVHSREMEGTTVLLYLLHTASFSFAIATVEHSKH